jgi:6-phosphogluconolactonase (cycloisomerase 2 family)
MSGFQPTRPGPRTRYLPLALSVAVIISVSPRAARAQATVRALFVSNNGNLEGSVTAFRINEDGTLSFVNRVITGSRPSISDPCAGCNAYEISITPSGQYLAVAHPAGDLDGITILRVASDATISQVLQIQLPMGVGGPLDATWIDDEYLAVTRLDTNPDVVVTYRFNPAVPSLTELSTAVAGGNSLAYLVTHPSRQYVYANDSGANVVRAFQVGVNGALSLIDTESTGSTFPLELAVTRDGRRLYAAGGISNGGNKIIGLNINPDGTLSPMSGSPYVSPGASPSNVFTDDSGKFAFAGHGTDATVRTFEIDGVSGALISTGFFFDVGLQGTLGDVAARVGLMFVTDNSTAIDGIQGVYSFTVNSDGSLTQNGPINVTQGIAPRSIATWIPRLKGDMNCNGIVSLVDLPLFVQALVDPDAYTQENPGCDLLLADMNDSGTVDGDDVQPYVGVLFGP